MNQQSGNKVQGNETIVLTEARPTLANKRQREIQKQACAPRQMCQDPQTSPSTAWLAAARWHATSLPSSQNCRHRDGLMDA